jgi:phosphatidylserine/phosphatidylglycerophosphate/cardiolipin synthase-like enzyme
MSRRKGSDVYFSPGADGKRAVDVVLGFIGHTERTLDVAIYSLTHDGIAAALIEAHKRGVRVRVLIDKSQAGSKYADDELLEEAGIEVRRDHETGIMHHKLAIADSAGASGAAGLGSFNWTKSAATRNRETWAVLRDPHVVAACQEEFERAWLANAPE